MRLDTLPEFDDEHSIEVVVADPYLIRHAADLLEGVIALGQMSDQLIALTGDDTYCSRVCESHGATIPRGRKRCSARKPDGQWALWGQSVDVLDDVAAYAIGIRRFGADLDESRAGEHLG